uniref:Uncharacterized protein n=1 Tax=Phenylobacterium glaciei TaxID=2803784 RepID=A0A974S8X9_9CAUL|nr:hypothetical protein JKL49_11810 [Phenylobacterium glaciei]
MGHSNGALYVETFATLFPASVAGVLYVDGVGSDDLDEPLVMEDLHDEETLARLAAVGGRMGLAPLVVQPTIDAIGLQDPAAHHKWPPSPPRHLKNARDEVLQILPALRRVREIGGSAGQRPPRWSWPVSLQPTPPRGHGGMPRRRRPGGRVRAGSSTPMAPPTSPSRPGSELPPGRD